MQCLLLSSPAGSHIGMLKRERESAASLYLDFKVAAPRRNKEGGGCLHPGFTGL